jgi:RNA polymerase sigma-B factor
MLHYLRDVADPVRLPRRLRQSRDWRVWSFRLRPLDALAEHQLLADPRCEGWSTLLRQERRHQVRLAMDTLEPPERRCVEQVLLSGQSLRQVGRVEGVSAMTIHRRLRRAMDRLRPRLAPLTA